MRRGERCCWCWGVTLLVLGLATVTLVVASQLDVTERLVAARVFRGWVVPGHPERSVLVWERIEGWFPVRFRVRGARWRDPACLAGGGGDGCVVALTSDIHVLVHPLRFLLHGRLEIQEMVVSHLALAPAPPAPPRRRLLSTPWPAFPYAAEVHTLRVDRVTRLAPPAMGAVIEDLLAHPRGVPRIPRGDVMLLGRGAAAAGGADWELAATGYMLGPAGDLAAGGHLEARCEDMRVTASAAAAGGTLRLTWDVPAGAGTFAATSPWGAAGGGFELAAGVLSVNATLPHNVTARGRVGRWGGPWPEDLTLEHPLGRARCGPASCRAHGVTVRPTAHGLVAAHALGNVTLGEPAPPVAWIAWRPVLSGAGRVETVVGGGVFEVAGGRLARLEVAGGAGPVRHGEWSAARVELHANLTGARVHVAAPAWRGHRSPGDAVLEVARPDVWRLAVGAHWLAGTAGRGGLVGRGEVAGHAVEVAVSPTGNVTLAAPPWAHARAQLDWRGATWWERFAAYSAHVELDRAFTVWGTNVSGAISADLVGGGRALPVGVAVLERGTVARAGHVLHDARGRFDFPSGEYTFAAVYGSGDTLSSEGFLVISPVSVEGQAYTHYQPTHGVHERADITFEWGWDS